MRYYLLDNRILYQTKDDDGKVIGFGVKQPVFMKAYPYYKLSFAPDGSQCIVQTESEVKEKEAKELTLAEAQAQTDEWIKGYEPAIKVTHTKNIDDENVRTESIVTVSINILEHNSEEIKKDMYRLHKAVS